MHTIHRFHSCESAQLVMAAMKRITNAKLHVNHRKVDKADRERGVGDWVIESKIDHNTRAQGALDRCVRMAIQLALADAHAQSEHYHSLTTGIWHLRPENRGSIGRYDINTA